MGKLESQISTCKERTVVKVNWGNPIALTVLTVLSRGVKKGVFVSRGGHFSKFTFRFDSIYG